ncbi:PDZ domain-containing protein [Allorhodopirellula heiligendammensis]|uniref:Serine endoprotease n=1 Tax=Allorhodopirellula heiligendammensis TaxID=2714739 RepID=A0A5C6BVB2_9BACT|nr:PDZ domain-containing protein [Allorhodopirellula heiligendammensis]TWU16223.1 serine endoprotease [Allorhodopirellula heiligendammensis]
MTFPLHPRLPFMLIAALALPWGPTLMQVPTLAQDIPNVQSTALIVDGRVENVFESTHGNLIQILVRRSEVPRLDALVETSYPAPGQYVYAHVSDPRTGISQRGRELAMPKPNSTIRAYLAVGQSGRWQASGDDWFEENPRDESVGGNSSQPNTPEIGITAQRVSVSEQSALKVIRVTPNSPAANSGIEPGDILVEANRVALESEDQLATAYRDSRGEFSLTVRDVRTGRDVLVQVATRSPSVRSGLTPRATTRTDGMQALGVTTELAFLNGEAVVKVTEVQPNSPASRSGLQAGLLILKANGESIESPADLSAAEQSSRGRLELIVVDPKDNGKTPRTVRVTL